MMLQPPSAHLEVSQIMAGFANLPPKPPRSKLEPYRDLIRELRRKGQTYRDVARLFQERLGLNVAPSTLHSFVKVRAKHRKRSQFELPPVKAAAADSPALQPTGVFLDSRAKTMDVLLHEWKSDLLRIWIPLTPGAAMLIGLFGSIEVHGRRDSVPIAAATPTQTAVLSVPSPERYDERERNSAPLKQSPSRGILYFAWSVGVASPCGKLIFLTNSL